MILDRVTVTGADDSIAPTDLVDITKRFPFVEWGILLSKSSEGQYRFPSVPWMERLARDVAGLVYPSPLKLSGHLCGRWVRDVCAGNWTIVEDRKSIYPMFHRIQLNFHAQVHTLERKKFLEGVIGFQMKMPHACDFIYQMDDVNNSLLEESKLLGVYASPLFDLSGGAGILPSDWPKSNNEYTGYAGGLSPENVAEQIEKIKLVAEGKRIWIDVERRVRSDDDSKFDLNKVIRFLEAAEPYVTKWET